MAGWSSIILRGVKAVAQAGGKAVKSTANTVASPAKVVTRGAAAARTAALPAAGGYVAWQNIVNDKPVLETVKEAVVGEDKSVVEAISDVAVGEKTTERIAGAVDSVANVADKASETLDTVSQTASSLSGGESGGLNGISNFFRNISSGEGILGTIGNLFGNIFKGNVSGMSMVGLVAAAFLTFGRFGWMAKIAGALLSMMIIGNNSSVQQTTNTDRSVSQGVAQEAGLGTEGQSRGMHR